MNLLMLKQKLLIIKKDKSLDEKKESYEKK